MRTVPLALLLLICELVQGLVSCTISAESSTTTPPYPAFFANSDVHGKGSSARLKSTSTASISPSRTSATTNLLHILENQLAVAYPEIARKCLFDLRTTGELNGGVVRGSLLGTSQIDGHRGFSSHDQQFALHLGTLSTSNFHDICFVHPASLDFRCNSGELDRLSHQPAQFTISEEGILLHDGRPDWKACRNMRYYGTYDLYSDRKSTKRLCLKVQLKLFGDSCSRPPLTLSKIPPAPIIEARGRHKVVPTPTVPYKADDDCHFQLSIVFGGSDFPIGTGKEYHMSGGYLISTHNSKLNYFYVDRITSELRSTDRMLISSQPKPDFTIDKSSYIHHKDTEKWIMCFHPFFGIYTYESVNNEDCIIVRLRAIGCKFPDHPEVAPTQLPPSVKKSIITSRALSGQQQTPDACTFPLEVLEEYPDENISQTYGNMSVTIGGEVQVQFGDFHNTYVQTGSRLQETSYGRDCFINATTFQFLCEHRVWSQIEQNNFSLRERGSNEVSLLHHGRQYWLLCPQLDGKATLWSDEKEDKTGCITVRISAYIPLPRGKMDWELCNMLPKDQEPFTTVRIGPQATRTPVSCPSSISNTIFEFPQLIVSNANKEAFHVTGNGSIVKIATDVGVLINFKVPATRHYINNTCALLYVDAKARNITTQRYPGEIPMFLFWVPDWPIRNDTSWSRRRAVDIVLNWDVTSEVSRVLATTECQGGRDLNFLVSSVGGAAISFVQKSSPTPMGLFLVPCT